MKIIDFEIIKNLEITPEDCVEWAETVIKEKNDYVLPKKTSIHFEENNFFNTMPCYSPKLNLFSVKLVSRLVERNPTIKGDILLYDTISGDLKAIVDGTWITCWRTAAVACVAVEKLKSQNAKSISLIGLGNIARAFVLCTNAIRKNESIHLNILAYKNQHELFIKRFEDFKNITFTVFDDVKEMIKVSDVIISCVTNTNSLFDEDDTDFKPGVLVVPVMTKGFQNCDLTFDKIYCDDIPHISNFKYFNQYKHVQELTEVINNHTFVRGGAERILAYNIGIGIQDMYFAAKILEKIEEEEKLKIIDKFWV